MFIKIDTPDEIKGPYNLPAPQPLKVHEPEYDKHGNRIIQENTDEPYG